VKVGDLVRFKPEYNSVDWVDVIFFVKAIKPTGYVAIWCDCRGEWMVAKETLEVLSAN